MKAYVNTAVKTIMGQEHGAGERTLIANGGSELFWPDKKLGLLHYNEVKKERLPFRTFYRLLEVELKGKVLDLSSPKAEEILGESLEDFEYTCLELPSDLAKTDEAKLVMKAGYIGVILNGYNPVNTNADAKQICIFDVKKSLSSAKDITPFP